jgi:hypothetical protein
VPACVDGGTTTEAAISIKPSRLGAEGRGQLAPVEEVCAGGMAPAQAPGQAKAAIAATTGRTDKQQCEGAAKYS